MKKVVTINRYDDKFEVVKKLIDMLDEIFYRQDEVIVTMETNE